ncbi:hypothetical protein KVG88_01585 [Pseudomonas sp. SWRI74]|uniref:Uncharacterized protein n=1 Tax=Pseudomonas azerbaijanoccidentalis TaxID=2842347 RepID=A0ABS6QIQ6_9PSED|nr:hypothetical protein [Pseudomonas azerbaijanoccidentalis]MBV4518735.1 hypothetical protein [Pseudomonas azerbaijanoccidentalis]
MSGNSLASLLAWMKNSSRMLGWGLVVALERRRTNLIVVQEYIRRFRDHSYLPAVRGEVMIVDNKRMELIHDFVMDVPVLSFENANLNDSKALLTMSVMGGSQLTLEKESVGWKAYKVDEIDPLKGPKLYLDLLLNEVSGDVDQDGRVKLDLSKSDNFRLTFAETQHEQRLGGDFFKDLFNQLPDDQRVYELGKIERGTNELMRPLSFELRTQASSSPAARDPKSPEFGDGAVLALVRMEKRLGGNFPGQNYKYLIPDDQGKDYSATVLLDSSRTIADPVLREVSNLLQSDEFIHIYDQDGELKTAVLNSGELLVPELEITKKITLSSGEEIEIVMNSSPGAFLSKDLNKLTVELLDSKVLIGWKPSTIIDFTFLTAGQAPGYFRFKLEFELLVEYSVEQSDSGVLLRRTGIQFVPRTSFESATGGDEGEFWYDILLIVLLPLVTAVYLTEMIFERFKAEFDERLNTEISITETIQEILTLNFGQAIQGNEIYAPHDIGFFGRINPQQTSFLIDPMQPIIKAGGSQRFATAPVVAGVQWKVENLVEGPGVPGTINASGVYQAPAASTIKGRFTRVRVTATAPGSGYFSSALVTVVVDELSIHPLIQVCDVGATVELSAGVLGAGNLQWSIKNPVPGESGELKPSDKPGGDRTYHHGPVVTTKTYVIDQVEVKNTSTGGTRSMHVLALQKQPMVSVRILSTDVTQGRVQLQASVNGNTVPDGRGDWSLAFTGQGTIDKATGVYRADPAATGRYALILFKMEIDFVGLAEGHLILPLPLVEFPQWLEIMSQ